MSPKRKKITAEIAKNIERLVEREQQSCSRVAKILNLNVRTVQIYVRKHRSDEINGKWIPFKSEAIKKDDKKVTDRRVYLRNILQEDCTLTLNKIVDKLPSDLKASIKTVSRDIKAIGFTHQRLQKIPIERNKPETIVSRKRYAEIITRLDNARLFFIDETGFNLHTGPLHGWSKVGITPSIYRPGNRQRNLSLVVCIGTGGPVHYEHISGSYNSDRFCEFLTNCLEKLPRDSTVVMDNASIHKTEAVKLVFDQFGIDLKYLPPYSPQLNPIEEFFSIVKRKQATVRPRPNDQLSLEVSIDVTMTELAEYDLSNLYRHMREFVPIARRSLPFE